MAEEKKAKVYDATSDAPPPDDDGAPLHQYSGGEVKELSNTNVSPWLWGFWSIVLVGGLLYFLIGGALGPKVGGGFKPTGGSAETKADIQQKLIQNANQPGLAYATLDLSRFPLPQGQTLDQAVDKGADTYQTYCIGCHGPNQDGNGVGAATLNPKPRNLHDGPFMQAMSYQRIMTSLHKGVPGTAMPRWENTLTEPEIQDVAVYVLSLTTPKPTAAPKSQSGSTTGNAGGSNEYQGGSAQNSPTPNTAAPGSTAPPSQSGTSSTTSGTTQPLKQGAPVPTGTAPTPNTVHQEPGSVTGM